MAPTRPPSDAEAVALLTRMLEVPSLSGQEGRLAGFLVEWMSARGLRAEVDAAGNAVGASAGQGPLVALVGHMDTVPGDIPVRREGRHLYGRGAVDAKGPLAAFIVAVCRAALCRAAGQSPNLVVVGAVEEEAASSRGARHIGSQLRPDYCIIGEPSGWNRVTIGYKGRLLLDYRLERPMAHTAGEAPGACEEAVDAWLAIRRWAEAHSTGHEGRFERADPSLRAICSESDGLTERVTMQVGLRLPPGLDPVIAEAQVRERVPAPATLEARGHEVAVRASKRGPLPAAFLAAIRAEGGQPAFVTKTGTSDMNVLAPLWGCPILAYGPGDSAYDHTPDERIDLDEYLRGIRVLERVVGRLSR